MSNPHLLRDVEWIRLFDGPPDDLTLCFVFSDYTMTIYWASENGRLFRHSFDQSLPGWYWEEGS